MKPTRSSGKWPIDRRYPRFIVDLRLIVKPVGTEAAATFHGRTKNISESGMAATLAGDLELGKLVELQFQLPGTGAGLTIRADVRYHHGSQYGFNFIGLTRQQIETIRQGTVGLPTDTSE